MLFSPGDYVCRKNEVGHEMYIVSRGILEVVTNEGKTVVATLKAGSYFGEISMLNVGPAGNRRTASVRSVGYSDLFCLNKQDLWDVLKNYPNAEARIRARAEERLSKLSDPNKPRKLNDTESPGVTSSTAKQAGGLNQNQTNRFIQEINRSGRSDSYTGSLLVSSNLRQPTSCSTTTTGGAVGSHRRRICSSSSCSKPKKFIRSFKKHSNSTKEIESSNLTSNIGPCKGGANPFTRNHKIVCSTRRCLGCNARLNNNEFIAKRPTVLNNDIRDCTEELDDNSNGKTHMIEDDDLNDCDAANDDVDEGSQSACTEDYEEEDNISPECTLRAPAKSRSDCSELKPTKPSQGLAGVCVKHGPTPSDTNKPLHRKSNRERRPNVARKPVLASLSRRNQVFIGPEGPLDGDQEYDSIAHASPVGHSRSFETGRSAGQTTLSPPYYESRLANRMTDGPEAGRFLEPNDRRQQYRYHRSESFSVKSVDSSLSGHHQERRRTRQLLTDQLSPQPASHETFSGRFEEFSSPYPLMRPRQDASPSESAPDSAKSMTPSNQQIRLKPIQGIQQDSTPTTHSPFQPSPPAEVDKGWHHLAGSSKIKQSFGRFNQLIAKGHSPTASSLDAPAPPSQVHLPVQVSDGRYLRLPVAIPTNSTVLEFIPSQQPVLTPANFSTPVIQSRSMSQLNPVQFITTAIPSAPANLSLSLNPIVVPSQERDSGMLLQGQQQFLILSTAGQPDSLNTGMSRDMDTQVQATATAQSDVAQVPLDRQGPSSNQLAMAYSNDSKGAGTVSKQIQADVVTNSARNRDPLTSSSTTQSPPSRESSEQSSGPSAASRSDP